MDVVEEKTGLTANGFRGNGWAKPGGKQLMKFRFKKYKLTDRQLIVIVHAN